MSEISFFADYAYLIMLDHSLGMFTAAKIELEWQEMRSRL